MSDILIETIKKLAGINESEVADRVRPKIKNQPVPTQLPGGFTVYVLNDHITPFEVAVEAVMSAIGLSEAEARRRMMKAHRGGGYPVAAYASKDIAETKAQKIMVHAQQNTNYDHLRRYTNGGRGWNGPWPLHAEVMEAGDI